MKNHFYYLVSLYCESKCFIKKVIFIFETVFLQNIANRKMIFQYILIYPSSLVVSGLYVLDFEQDN